MEYRSDPRSLISTETDAVLIADPTLGLETDVIEAMMNEAAHASTRLLTLLPRPATFAEACQLRSVGALPRPIGLLGDVAAGRGFFEAVREFGVPGSIQLAFDAMYPCGGCAGRLYDLFDVLHELFGSPHAITAAVGRSSRIERVTGMATYADGRVASFSAGDDAGDFSRSMTLWNQSGRFRWVDGALSFADGQDDAREASPKVTADPIARVASELAESVAWAIDQPLATSTDSRRIDVLGAVETCMLAARTGEAESVDHVRGALDRV